MPKGICQERDRALPRAGAALAALLLLATACTGGDPQEADPAPSATQSVAGQVDGQTDGQGAPPTTPDPAGTASAGSTPSAALDGQTQAPPVPVDDLLVVAQRKDGDSFVASDGVEYRVGLINTPELAACGGPEATDVGMALLADGFAADGYATDDNGRTVARITLADGRDYGVVMAAEGMADDRYLEQFRDEAPDYADLLDDAFASARAAGAGLWGTCWSSRDEAAAQPLVGGQAGGSSSAPAPPPPGADVVVVRVVNDTAGNDMGFDDSEHVVLANRGDADVDIGGWHVEDEAGHVLPLPAGTILRSGAELRLHSGPGEDGPGAVHLGLEQAVWNNSGGDTATLKAGDIVVSQLTYR